MLLASFLPLIFKPNDTAINNRQHRGRRRELSCALPRIFTFLWLFFALCLIKTFITLMWGTQKRKCRRKPFAKIERLLLGAQQFRAPLICAM
ncbi:hypothetical protein BGK51_22645 [Shigella sp. FC569]|nr:hypothetical protein BGK51_22645 [Shigella sp. FC569]